MTKTYQSPKLTLADDEVFVFTSNLSGFSGAGSAGFASFGKAGNVWREFEYDKKPNGWKGKWNVKGIAEGPQVGTEGKSYAIPTATKAGAKRSIPLETIGASIKKFYEFAKSRPHLKFFVAQENKVGLNGYSPDEMASIYSGEIPENVYFDEGFAKLLFTKNEVSCKRENTQLEQAITELAELGGKALKATIYDNKKYVNEIIHCKRGKFDQYIGRPKSGAEWGFGNPFEIGKDGNREVVIQKFARWLTYGDNAVNQNATEKRRQWILDHVEDLHDKVLGCWCNYPKEDCHGRVLKELAQMLVRDREIKVDKSKISP